MRVGPLMQQHSDCFVAALGAEFVFLEMKSMEGG
jgi:hypothetical protein